LRTNISGAQNTALGAEALYASTGNANVGVGFQAGRANTSGQIIAIGYQAMVANTTGTRNIAIGSNAYDSSDTEDDNIAIGHNAMTNNSAGGIQNVVVGNYAGDAITSGDGNTLVGHLTGTAITSANHNTCVGRSAGGALVSSGVNVLMGELAGASIATGDGHNNCFGFQSGYYSTAIVSGEKNICIGAYARTNATDADNCITIGYDIETSANQFGFGKASNKVSNVFTTNATFARNSDLHKKTNIESTDLGLSFINELRPVTFNWRPNSEFPKHYDDYSETENNMTTDINLYGMIAQEVKTALDKVGHKNFGGWSEESDGSQMLAQSMFIYPLINAVQELSAEVEALKAKLKD